MIPWSSGRRFSAWSCRTAKRLIHAAALVVRTPKPLATASQKYMSSSCITHTMSPTAAAARASSKLALQLWLMASNTEATSEDVTRSSERRSLRRRKVKSGWWWGFRELKNVWAIVIEKPFWCRNVARWSIGLIWPWYGHGTSSKRCRFGTSNDFLSIVFLFTSRRRRRRSAKGFLGY